MSDMMPPPRRRGPDAFVDEEEDAPAHRKRRFPYTALALLAFLGLLLIAKILFELSINDLGGLVVVVPAVAILGLVARIAVRK